MLAWWSFVLAFANMLFNLLLFVYVHALDVNNSLHLYLFTFFSAVFLIRIMPHIYILRIELFLDSICHFITSRLFSLVLDLL